MIYNYKIENLDCANCANKAENAITKLNGVKSCRINFFNLKMQLETENEQTEGILSAMQSTIKRIIPDMKLREIK